MRLKLDSIRTFAMALAVAVSAGNVFAADVAPLYFDGVAADDQQPYWEELMSFKMWGTEGISFGHATLTDLSGAVGTAHDLDLQIEKHTIGGPLYVGGNISGSNGGDTLLSGPVRVKGNFTAGQNGSRYNGLYCIEGSANNRLTEYAAGYGTVFQGSDAKTGECSYDNIKDVPTYLTIPKIPDHAYEPAISINGSYTIDVPPLSDGKMHDFYFEKISFNNSATLIIRMESAKSLARIFLRDNINVSSATNIKIVYVDKGATFVNGHWTNVTTETQVANADYAGNLMFYMKGDMTWPAMNKGMAEQGTFISQGTITVGPNLNLAGQFLATNVVVGHEFDGSGFRYVPFDPPILKLEPEVGQPLDFSENDTWTKVSIKLDVAPSTAVRFDYCFEFAPDWYFTTVDEDGVRLYDKAPAASLDDVTRNGVKPFPLCGESTAKVEFAAGSRIPKEDYSVWINAKIDNNVEPKESIRLQIHNLEGAVMPGGERDGEFEVFIIDGDSDPSSDDHAFTVAEDEAHVFVGGSSAKGTACAAGVDFCYHTNRDRDQAGVTIMTVPERGTLTYKGKPVVAGEDGEVGLFVPVEDLAAGKLAFRSNEHDYDADGVYGSFEFTVTDVGDVDHGYPQAVSDRYTITIYVTPVNDYPTVVENQNMSVPENSPAGTTVGAFDATDVDGDKLKFEFDTEDENFETVSALFDINQENGLVTVKEGAVLDFESSATIFTITVKVTDDASTTGNVGALTSTGTLTINVTDVNEIQSVVIKDADDKVVQDSILRIDEGSKYPDVVGTVLGDDPDVNAVDETWNTFTYKIVENSDADKTNDVPFYLNEKTGLIKVDNIKDLKLDYETDSVFVFHVEVTDKAGEFTVIKEVTVKLNDINEAPEFGTVSDAYEVNENAKKDSIFGRIDLIDQDAGESGKMVVALTDNNKTEGVTSAEDLFDVAIVPGESDKNMQITIFVKNDSLLDYESLYKAHYDSEAGKVVFDVTLTVTDKDGSEITTTTKINVVDVNEAPTAKNGNFKIAENASKGDSVGVVKASDPDTYNTAFKTLTYTIVQNSDDDETNDVPFVISNKGKITVSKDSVLDFETQSSYTFDVQVTDGSTEPAVVKVTVTLIDVLEKPTFADKTPALNVDENSLAGTEVGVVSATDDDCKDEVCTALTYELAPASKGSLDTSFFVIDPTTGRITVKADSTLNFEEKATYTVDVIVYDGVKGDENTLTDTAHVTISINDVNDAPVVANKTLNVPENSHVGDTVGTVVATDEDKWAELTYTLADVDPKDAVAEIFAIDENGKITVNKEKSLDYESRSEYQVLVIVKDNGSSYNKDFKDLSDTAVITIKVTDVNEDPGFDDKAPVLAVDENSLAGTEVGIVSASDDDCKNDDCNDLVYELAPAAKGNMDTSLFVIDAATGRITVKADSTLNYEVKATYKVKVIVYDGEKGGKNTLTDTALVTININDVNDAPVVSDTPMEVHELASVGDTVGTVVASDEDKWAKLTYTLADVDPKDAVAEIFQIDANGVITVAKEKVLDFETRSEYKVKVIVTDNGSSYNKKFKDLSDTAIITISLKDDPESPEIVDDGKTKYDVEENSPTGLVVAEFVVKDQDASEVTTLIPSIIDRDNAGADTLFNIDLKKDGDDWKIQVTVADSSALDYETLKHSYNVTFKVVDDTGLSSELNRVINIVDVNEIPVVKNFSDSIPENYTNGSVVGALDATDPDVLNPKFSTLTYTILTKNVPFVMDSNKIVVADASKLDYETKSSFTFKVRVSDGTYSDTATVKIYLTDEDENPTIDVDDDDDGDDDTEDKCIANCDTTGRGNHDGKILTVAVEENVATGTPVFAYTVSDEDTDEVTRLTPSLKDNNKTGADSLFQVSMEEVDGKWKVVVSVKDESKLDYEKINPSHEVTVYVTDPKGLKDSIVRVINVIDVNENPVLKKQEFEFVEHNADNKVIGTIKASDLDTAKAFTNNVFELVGGDKDVFKVSETGVITATKEFDYESEKHEYKLVVAVKDKDNPKLVVKDTMTIVLKNKAENPAVAETEFNVDEHVAPKTPIDTLTAADPDCVGSNKCKFTYELVEPSPYVSVTEDGVILVEDSTRFNFETVESIKITVVVTDEDGLKSEPTVVTIKINDVNEAPVIVDQTIKVPEDAKPKTVIDTVVATDPDTKSDKFSDLTYTVVGGDSTVFAVDSKTGEVILKDSLDFETKPEYKLVVEVFDGQYRDTATVTVKVENIDEKSVVEITKVTDGDSTWTKPDSVFTNRPEVTICWNEGREVCEKAKCTVKSKEVCQDTTLTEGSHTIVKEYIDPTTDKPGRDSVVVFVSTSTPIVTVTANVGASDAANIYTIEETLDEKDSSIYVNDSKNDILVTIKDPVTKKDSSFVVKLELDTLSVKEKDLSAVASVAEKSKLTLNLNPTSGVTRTPVNGEEIKMSYTEEVNGKKVTVSYVTDNDGEILKSPVVDEKGKVDSIEVITVSYETTIGGKKVTVSYQADAITGQVLNVAADGTLTFDDKIVVAGSTIGKPASSSSSKPGSSSSGKPGSSSSGSKPSSSGSNGSSDDSGNGAGSNELVLGVGSFKVTYDYVDERGNSVVVTYTIDEKGNIVKNSDGDIGYTVSYTYENKFGNSATQSVYIVLDQVGPKVEILFPTNMQVVYSNYVEVTWAVNGVIQDTLTVQGLEKGINKIVRFYRDKAGNVAYDSVFVRMKDGKDVDLAVETPVVQLTQDKVEEYYAVNPPKEGEKVAISIKNPTTGKEVETQIAGSFGTEDGSYDTPYPGVSGEDHLGPTVAMDIRLPVVNNVGGLATMDDLIGSDGLVSLDGVDAKNSDKVTVDEYVETYCKEGFKYDGDLSRVNLYKSRMDVKVWIYTTLGNFVDYYSFRQDLNDPDYTNEAGLLQMYFEMKPDRDGEVRTADGHVLATGAYLYKVEAKVRAELQCTLPPVKDETAKKKGDVIKKSDEMLKSFGYKRPEKK